MVTTFRSLLVSGIVIPLLAGQLVAQNATPMSLQRLNGTIDVDGDLSDAAWQRIAPVPLTLYLPVFRGEPSQRTEIRVTYDSENVYLGGWFFDDAPRGIRINSLYRDRWSGDDAFAIYIDPFNDNRNAKWFGVTPAGVRFDQLVSDDGATLNGSWDGFWDAKTSVNSAGWFVEVRIPLSTLGFEASADTAVMGLTVSRLVSRLNERVTFPAIDPRYQFRQPSVAQDIVLRNVRTSKPLYLSPYLLAGVQHTPTLTPGEAHYRTVQHLVSELGMDLRYALTSQLTLDATLNTDFAQVEADDQQVNLDRFSLFFPEKRRFFQERAELFDFTMGNSGGRLFHSRQIGFSNRASVPVIGGARIVGRLDAWDLGLLSIQTQQVPGTPGENFSVARVRRSILNEHSSVGGLLTSRVGPHARNIALGVDASIRVIGDDYLTLKVAHTSDANDSASVKPLDRVQAHLNWRRRASRGLLYEGELTYSGSAFNPATGFQQRKNFTAANLLTEYHVFTDPHPVLRRFWPGMLAFSTFNNSRGTLESGQYALWLQWETKRGGGGFVQPKLYVEDVYVPFTIAGAVEIPVANYKFYDVQLALNTSAGRPLRVNFDGRAGTYFDGTRIQGIIVPTWSISPHLEISGEYQRTRLRFPARGQEADINLGRARVRTALNSRLSGTAFVQYNSTTRNIGLNFRARYNFAEGTDLWFVYDEGLTVDRDDPIHAIRPPFSTGRTLMIKYTRTWGL